MTKIALTKKYKTYPEYKNSGVDWIGDVPRDWGSVPLKSLFRRVKRTGHAQETLLSVYRDWGVIEKSSREDNFNKASDDLSAYQLVLPGDLVTNKMKTWQGSIAISNLRGIVSPAYYVFRPLTKQSNAYYHYLLRSDRYISHYESISKGIRVNQWDLDDNQMKITTVLVPTPEEQKRIANFLDEKTVLIDRIIEKKQRLIELLKEKRAAVINHAVTKGLDKNVKMTDGKIELIGNIPKEWKTIKGKYLFRYKKEINNRYQCNHVLALTLRGVINKEDYEQFSLTPTDYASYQIFEKNDLVFKLLDLENRQTSRVGLVPQTGIMSPAYIRLVPNAEIYPDYYYWLYYAYYIRGVFNFLGLGVRSTLNHYDLLSLSVPVPKIGTQVAISAYLNKEISSSNALEASIVSSIEILREFKSSLISHAVTGKIRV